MIEGHRATIGVEFAAEASALSALPSEGFDVARHVSARVDAKARVCVRQCRYSVPVSFIGSRLDVAIGASEIVVSAKGSVVATHERLVRRSRVTLSRPLPRGPGAQAGGARPRCRSPRRGRPGRSAPSTTPTGPRPADGWATRRARGLIDALLLARTLPRDAVVAGMSAALALCTVSPEVVAIEARRAAGERLAEVTPLTSLAGDNRPAPDLAAYDDLLGERRVGR